MPKFNKTDILNTLNKLNISHKFSNFMRKQSPTSRILYSLLLGIFFSIVGISLCLCFFFKTYDYVESIMVAEASRITDAEVNIVDLQVTEDTTLQQVAKELYKNNIITNKNFFLLEAKLDKNYQHLIKGTYTLTSNMPTVEILNLLTTVSTGEKDTLKFTIPEGYTVEQIAERLASLNIVSKKDFLSAVTDRDYDDEYTFLQQIPPDLSYKYKLEGYLFPDTYIIRKNASAEEIVIKMLNRFQDIYDSYASFIPSTGYTGHELLTIASIIEQEVRLDEERPIISGIIDNRIKHNMPLQMCSSVQYSLNKRKAALTYEDLQTNSPYNTYLNKGLPIGPICNPGEACIKAAFFPQDNDYYFFVLKDSKTGSHAFSHTFKEHNEEKSFYKQSDDINFTQN